MYLEEQEVRLAESKLTSDGQAPMRNYLKPKVKRPQLQVFEDGKDDLGAYIERFERFAKIAEWPSDDWAVSLGALLTGKALEVYSRFHDFSAGV